MRIAFLLPSLANKGPISVAKDIVNNIVDKVGVEEVCVFYFDSIVEIEFNSKTQQVSFRDRTFLRGYDIVHSHGLRPDLYLFLFRKDIKSITTTHNIIIDEYRSNYNSFIAHIVEKFWCCLLNRHDKIVSLNKIMASYYMRQLKNKVIYVVNNGRKALVQNNTISFQDKEKIYNLKKRYKIIGTACYVTKRKGLHQIIKILPKLKDFFFILIGNGEELCNLKEMADFYGVSDRCWFLGYKTNATSYYPFFDFYIISSYAEGLPLALLEAASLGIPSLCSSIPAHREVFDETEVSFFQLDDKDSLIEAINNLEYNKETMRKNMLEKYNNNYTPRIMADKYLQLYKDLIISK